MKITALVENRSDCGLKTKHGLSLYVETPEHRILFDVGPDDTLFENSETRGVDLSTIDTMILSHGHYDHGGALEKFLEVNHTAKVYAQRKAFEKHYAKNPAVKDISIDPDLRTNAQVVLLDGDYTIDNELTLFTVSNTEKCHSGANDVLYSETGQDDFSHEQNLMILGGVPVLIMGCGHTGVVNILEKAAAYKPRVCVGGYHLFNPDTGATVPKTLLDDIAREMAKYDIRYYTCHCTGTEAYAYLAERLPEMHYLACGDMIEI
ncbi:MAG: MBL fold metallo-hydrolase [Clostridiales bacterium]|nr:MBL fold metallo-hydrolase [Clostridiales bacterium]